MVADDRDDRAQRAEAIDDAGAVVAVALHHLELLAREAPGLEQDGVGDRELADVVEEGAEPQQLEPRRLELELAPDPKGDLDHSLRVPGG